MSSIEVTAVGEDPQQVTLIAATAAAELLNLLKTRAESDRAAQRDSIVSQLDDISRQLNELTAQIATNPLNRSQLEAEQRSLSNQYSMVYEQFTKPGQLPRPSAGLATLQAARAKPISQSTYRDTLQTIQNRPEYVTGRRRRRRSHPTRPRPRPRRTSPRSRWGLRPGRSSAACWDLRWASA